MWCVSRFYEGTVTPSSCVRAAARLSRAHWRVGLTALLIGSFVWAAALAHAQSTVKAGPVVSYRDGLLTINPQRSPLHDVLNAIRDRVGFTLDLPPNGMDAKVLDEQIGPAPVKDVLLQLLYGCGVNYIIQTVPGTPQDVQRIFVSTPSRASGRESVVAAARPQEDGGEEPQIYGGFIPANPTASELTPVRPVPGQQAPSSAENVPGIPANFNLQQAAAEAHKTPGEILDELQKQQSEILDSQAPPPQ